MRNEELENVTNSSQCLPNLDVSDQEILLSHILKDLLPLLLSLLLFLKLLFVAGYHYRCYSYCFCCRCRCCSYGVCCCCCCPGCCRRCYSSCHFLFLPGFYLKGFLIVIPNSLNFLDGFLSEDGKEYITVVACCS